MKHCLLISGFGAPGFEWRISPIRTFLQCSGFQLHNVRSGVGHPGDRAKALTDYVTELDGEVYAVGHSMGGVVARTLDTLTGSLRKIVTLGSPHRGVGALNLLPIHLLGVQAIQEHSSFSRHLAESEHYADYLCVAGSRDVLVTRRSAWGVKGSEKEIVPSTHAQLIARKDVTSLIGEFFA